MPAYRQIDGSKKGTVTPREPYLFGLGKPVRIKDSAGRLVPRSPSNYRYSVHAERTFGLHECSSNSWLGRSTCHRREKRADKLLLSTRIAHHCSTTTIHS